MKPMNYLDPVVCSNGFVKPMSEFAGGGSGGVDPVDCLAELSTNVTGLLFTEAYRQTVGGVHFYHIKCDPTGVDGLGSWAEITGLRGSRGIVSGLLYGSGGSITNVSMRVTDGKICNTTSVGTSSTTSLDIVVITTEF